MEKTTEDKDEMTSQQQQKIKKQPGLSTLKLFIVALSFAYFSKALTGAYMKGTITQIERRFDLSSTHIGLIDGSFEMGNLLFLAVVSYFGAKLHRPRLIAVGCSLMAVGALLTGLTHFLMKQYEFDTVIQIFQNDSANVAACVETGTTTDPPKVQNQSSDVVQRACGRESGSHLWIYVFLGNALRGIGETPVTPLGVSYIDDFAKAENSPFYIACLQTISLLGPMFGFLMGSYFAKLYVDIGYVDMDSVSITPNDARWVGAWWMGFLVSSVVLMVSSVPFWFLPRSLPKPEEESDTSEALERTDDLLITSLKLSEIAKGFLPSLKRLMGTPSYFLLLCGSVLRFNSLIGEFTFKAKYLEQQFGQSASRANFLIGVLILPTVALGIFLGGLLMKRYKLSVVSGAQLSFATSFLAYLLMLLQFGTKCDNVPVAGLTVSYDGAPTLSSDSNSLFSECNRNCSCSVEEWDPVCSDSGVTYVSPCMSGCLSSSGQGKNTVFHNCSCVSSSSSSTSVKLGQCPHSKACSRSFTSYMAVSVLSWFINSLGATPGYMVVIRCISPELKSLALGMQVLATRTLGGIPAPIYFGALIDSTCLKWAVKRCGGRGACRIYDSDTYRLIFLGLITSLSGSSYFFVIAVIVLLRRQFKKPQGEEESQQANVSKDMQLEATSNPSEAPQSPGPRNTPNAGRTGSSSNAQGTKRLQNTTENPVESDSQDADESQAEMSELEPDGGGATAGNDQITEDQCTCDRAEAGQSQKDPLGIKL